MTLDESPAFAAKRLASETLLSPRELVALMRSRPGDGQLSRGAFASQEAIGQGLYFYRCMAEEAAQTP